MLHYILDGNNLIGQHQQLKQIQKSNKQASREKLAFMIGNYFADKKVNVSLHFDGYPKESIRILKAKIIYSENKSADEIIKNEIEFAKNRTKIILVSSDNNLKEFAKVCGCKVLSSLEFISLMNQTKNNSNEKKIDDNDLDFYKKLFNE
ncbi:MAG TPA: NYN domain-containing protein [Ignavibacteriaceae bacterium]|nr:NYN domain-containing protein [Ignavibacteriaceae bacterium]